MKEIFDGMRQNLKELEKEELALEIRRVLVFRVQQGLDSIEATLKQGSGKISVEGMPPSGHIDTTAGLV